MGLVYLLLTLMLMYVPEMSGIDLCNDERCVVPCRSRDSSKQAEHDDHHHLRMNHVEQEHRESGGKQTECWEGKIHTIHFHDFVACTK